MTLKIADRVFETTTTTGTGSITLAGAVTGFQPFSVLLTGSKVPYYIDDGDSSGLVQKWEAGIGTITVSGGTTLSRDIILASSNSNVAVNFGAGTKNVRGGIPAGVLPITDENLNNVREFGIDSGTANAHAVTLSYIPKAYSDGMPLIYRVNVTNTATSVTVAIGALATKALKINGADPAIGQLVAGTLIVAYYKSATNIFEIISIIPSTATTTAAGLVQLATDAEFKTGTSTSKAITPSNVKNSIGFTNFYESSETAVLTATGTYSVSHGLGAIPKFLSVILRNKTAEGGYAVADEVAYPISDVSGTGGVYFGANSTNIFGAQNTVLRVFRKDTGAAFTITPANWKFVFRAWA